MYLFKEMSRGRLKIEDEETIRRNYRFLKNELESRDLLDYLYENKVITLEDKNRIHYGKTRSERNEDLLQTILHSGPGPSFELFLSSLEERYPQVCSQLKTKDGVSLKPCESPDDIVTVKSEVENDNDSEAQRLNDELLAQKDVKIKMLCTELKEVKAQLAQKDVENQNLTERLTEVTTERDETLVQLIEKNVEKNELKASLDEAHEQLLEKSEDIEELKSRLDVADTNVSLKLKLIDFLAKPQYKANLRDNKLLYNQSSANILEYERARLKLSEAYGTLLKLSERKRIAVVERKESMRLLKKGPNPDLLKDVEGLSLPKEERDRISLKEKRRNDMLKWAEMAGLT